ncbi:MAG: hydroxymethylbilane synthase [Dehalococcoidia bacterium]|nr:hydroxymethylbilane synthase [Dehalococcoidia bacterium]
MKTRIIVGSRGSKLALRQTDLVLDRLKSFYPEIACQVRVIKTTGDRDLKSVLDEIGGQGVFVKELEAALLSGEIDMAIHSLKDMPSELDMDFKLAAVCMRTDARDAFISSSGLPLAQLPLGASIATGSLRRAAQLRQCRPDIAISPVRGNVDTRLRKLNAGEFDGIIIAAAALARLGWQDRITEYLPIQDFLPAPGQGALAVETRAYDTDLNPCLEVINEEPLWQSITAERAFLRTFGAGCRIPVAAFATVQAGNLRIKGMAASIDGTTMLRDFREGPAPDAERIGRILAESLLGLGARELIHG